MLWSSNGTNSCYTEGSRQRPTWGQELRYCVVKVVTIEVKQLSHDKVLAILGKWRNQSVTLVISRWKVPTSPPPECEGIDAALSHYHPSSRLLRDAQRYNDLHLHNSSYSAVMIMH